MLCPGSGIPVCTEEDACGCFRPEGGDDVGQPEDFSAISSLRKLLEANVVGKSLKRGGHEVEAVLVPSRSGIAGSEGSLSEEVPEGVTPAECRDGHRRLRLRLLGGGCIRASFPRASGKGHRCQCASGDESYERTHVLSIRGDEKKWQNNSQIASEMQRTGCNFSLDGVV